MNSLIALLGSDFCANLLTALLHTLWQGIAIAGLLLMFLSRRVAKDANVRYAASLVALGAIVLCGLLTWAVLDYEPRQTEQALAERSSPKTIVTTDAQVQGISEGKLATFEASEPALSSSHLADPKWRAWAICSWLSGVIMMLLRAVFVAVGGRRLGGQSSPLRDELMLDLVEQLRKSIGITRRIRVGVSGHICVPGVVGCFWPTLLLPVSMVSGVPLDDLRAIIAHELAHVRRYDYIVNFCQMLVEAILFFNPAVWWISRQIRFEREACCDEVGLAAVGQRIRYAEVLADWARRLNEAAPKTPAPAVAFGKPHESGYMLERIHRIVVAEHRPRLKVSWYIAAATLVLSFAILIGLWRGTTMTVALAGKLLTPQERIDKIKEIAQTYDPQERQYGPEDRLQLSGTIRTVDGNKLPEKTQFVIHGFSPRRSSSIATDVPNFSTSIEYFSKVLFRVTAPGYAPLISKTYEPQPGETISGVELVLDKGFAGRLRFVDRKGEPIAGTKLSGTYFMPVKNGWHGLNTIDEVVSGEDGMAVIEHCIERTVKLSARANGYQEDSNRDIELKPGEVFVWELVEARPATGIVVSRTTGAPIAGAELRLCRKDKSDHRWSFGGSGMLVLATTNNQGQFTLGTLNNEWQYTFIVAAQNYNSTLLRRVKMGDEGLKVELGPELYLAGKVIGDLSKLSTLSKKPTVGWETNYHDTEGGVYDNGWVDVEVADGVGHFVIRNIVGDYVTIRAGDKTRQVEIKDKSIEDFVIDLRPEAQTPQNMRQVVLEFDVPEGSPLPEGEVRINTNSQENHAKKTGGTSDMYPIADGRIRMDVPVPGRLSYDLNWSQGPRIMGYWIEGKSGIEIPAADTPFVLHVPTHLAGTIYGQVLEADGALAEEVTLQLMTLRQSPVMEYGYSLSHVFGYSEKEVGKFNASPLPLGGEYVIVAYRDSTFAASDAIALDKENPIRQTDIRFAEGLPIRGQVTAPDGAPFADAVVTLTASVRFGEGGSWGTGAGRMTTGADGRFGFEHVNPKLPGHYELRVEAGPGYQRVQMEIAPGTRPVNIKLQRGYRLAGVLLDDATGWPIPDAQIWAEAIRKTGKAGDHAQADAKTDEEGRFQFSTLAQREYRLYLAGAEILSPARMEMATGGQSEQVTLRVKLREWSDLTPRKKDE